MKEKKQTLITVADDFENIAGIYHVGTPLYSLGKTLGEMVQKDHNSGQVFIITHDAASDRMKGILDQLEADFSVEILEVGSQNTLITMDAAQKVLLQHREDIILIGDGLVSLTGVLRATVDLKRLQNVDIYGFGYSEEIAEALEYGGIHGTIDEDPEWLAVNALNTFEASYYNRPELLEENTFFPRIYYTRN